MSLITEGERELVCIEIWKRAKTREKRKKKEGKEKERSERGYSRFS